jgi:serine/threonine protein kinase
VLFAQLLALDLDLRQENGDKLTPEEYEGRFQEYRQQIRAAFAKRLTVVESGPVDERHDLSQPEEPPLPTPTRIGDRFEVRRRLGEGGFGTVYLAYDEVMKCEVAVKVPSPNLLATQRQREEFLREAQNAAQLKHEGIVRVHNFGQEDDGRCFIVYEYIEGNSLKERIAAGRISLQEATRIVARVAEALHHAHEKGLVHRDIKPANILVDRDGRPHITDFGLAVREEDLAKERDRLAGTLPYMSPQQVRCECDPDSRNDIYSLGVVLYELLCSRPPFVAETTEELKHQIIHREAKPLRLIKDSIPKELECVCLKALSKRIQDRYPTAKDFAEELVNHARKLSTATIDCPHCAFTVEIRIDHRRELRCPRCGYIIQIQNSGVHEALPVDEIERRMVAADENELPRLLGLLAQTGDIGCVPTVFRYLAHPGRAVRTEARNAIHSLGWQKVSSAIDALARAGDAPAIGHVLDGLSAFKADPEVVGILDRLAVILKGDLRTRAIQLLERKRLGLELNVITDLFKEIHSPYQIDKALGQGLLTAAYLAHTDGGDLKVVVRILRSEFVNQPHIRALFLDLSRKWLPVVHENLAVTLEVRDFQERNIYFAVRHYVDGVTLQKALEQGKRFEPHAVVALLRALASALVSVHRQGLSHGGVKPSNIFLCEGGRVILGDPSLPLQVIGVAPQRLSYDYRYAAPEMFGGNGEPGPQSDLYSLGCVAYELASGQPPFVSDNYVELAARHLHEAIAPPSQRGSRLGRVGDEVLLKMLARSPADRYPDAMTALSALMGIRIDYRRPLPSPAYMHHPLVSDASLDGLRGAESIIGFDAASASTEGSDAETHGSVRMSPAEEKEKPLRAIERVGRSPSPAQVSEPDSSPAQDEVAHQFRPQPKTVEMEKRVQKIVEQLRTKGKDLAPIAPIPPQGAEKPNALEDTEARIGAPAPLEQVDASFPLGLGNEEMRTLGRFQLLERVGHGGFGTVWRARDMQLDRIVAIKIPHAGLLSDGQHWERFQREARAAAQLLHPNIVPLYEIATIDGIPVLVSAFVEGVPLSELIKSRRLTFRESAELIAQIAEALGYAHHRGLVHRDIKPGNIIVSRADIGRVRQGEEETRSGGERHLASPLTPMIVDFGLAVRAEAETVMTVEGQLIGSPAYMSPEQASGHGHNVDVRSDIYSLGTMFYQLLCGELPFPGPKTLIVHQVLYEEPRPPRSINPKIPRDLETICLKAIAKKPDRRYATARELADDLRRWLEGDPIAARPSTRVERWWRALTRFLTFRSQS